MYEYAATVRRVIDGDTVDMEVDLGFHMKASIRFRLTGINTPERNQPGWADASACLRTLLPIGQEVRIRTGKADSFGRWVALIKRPDMELTVNRWMVEHGHAVLFAGRYANTLDWAPSA